MRMIKSFIGLEPWNSDSAYQILGFRDKRGVGKRGCLRDKINHLTNLVLLILATFCLILSGLVPSSTSFVYCPFNAVLNKKILMFIFLV